MGGHLSTRLVDTCTMSRHARKQRWQGQNTTWKTTCIHSLITGLENGPVQRMDYGIFKKKHIFKAIPGSNVWLFTTTHTQLWLVWPTFMHPPQTLRVKGHVHIQRGVLYISLAKLVTHPQYERLLWSDTVERGKWCRLLDTKIS